MSAGAEIFVLCFGVGLFVFMGAAALITAALSVIQGNSSDD